MSELVISLLGYPNCGKSTLLNHWSNKIISIATRKAQTTRRPTVAWLNCKKNESQVAIIDTPGISRLPGLLAKGMMQGLIDSIYKSDYTLLMFDAAKSLTTISQEISYLKTLLHTQGIESTEIIIAINKVDKVEKSVLLLLATELGESLKPKDVFMISARKGSGCHDLFTYLCALKPIKHSSKSDIEQFELDLYTRLAEITRKNAFEMLHQEIPYSLTVKTKQLQTNKSGDWLIKQEILTSEKRHKSIIIGKKGQGIKQLGQDSRQEMMKQFSKKIHLFLTVRHDQMWVSKDMKEQLSSINKKADM